MTPALFSFSGPRASQKENIFHEAERLYREHYPDQPLAFVEAVPKRPHPLGWDTEHRNKHPTSRLAEGFAAFNEAGIRVIKPAIAAGKIVVSLRYGLDVYLDALADTDCPQARRETFELWHHHLVPARVIRGTPKPVYFIACKLRPDNGNIEAFFSRQEKDIREYFNGTGQNPPIFLEGTCTRSCAQEALTHILTATKKRSACA